MNVFSLSFLSEPVSFFWTSFSFFIFCLLCADWDPYFLASMWVWLMRDTESDEDMERERSWYFPCSLYMPGNTSGHGCIHPENRCILNVALPPLSNMLLPNYCTWNSWVLCLLPRYPIQLHLWPWNIFIAKGVWQYSHPKFYLSYHGLHPPEATSIWVFLRCSSLS